MFKLLVTGGKNFKDGRQLERALTAIHRRRHITLLITGTLPGAEEMAYHWACRAQIARIVTVPPVPTMTSAADYGLRNLNAVREMRPDGVVAFPGTGPVRSVIDLALRAGITVWEVPPDWR